MSVRNGWNRMSWFKETKTLNSLVYNQLNEVLKMLDKKWNLKCYSLVLDNNDNCKEILRVKRTLPLNNNIEPEISQDNINELKYLFNELGLDVNFEEKDIRTKFLNYCNQQKFSRSINSSKIVLNDSQNNEKLSNIEDVHQKSTNILELSS